MWKNQLLKISTIFFKGVSDLLRGTQPSGEVPEENTVSVINLEQAPIFFFS